MPLGDGRPPWRRRAGEQRTDQVRMAAGPHHRGQRAYACLRGGLTEVVEDDPAEQVSLSKARAYWWTLTIRRCKPAEPTMFMSAYVTYRTGLSRPFWGTFDAREEVCGSLAGILVTDLSVDS